MSKGCIQGSACGPVLWNIILDELLDMQVSSGCHLQAFADDVLLIVTAKDVHDLQNKVIQPIVTYAAGIWGHIVSKEYVKKKMISMQRGFAIKAIKGFRTLSTTASLALARFMPLDLKIREVHFVERARLSGHTHYLPDNATYERPTPVHELLHPADRISIQFNETRNQDEVDSLCRIDSVQVFTDGSKQEDGSVGAAFVACDPDKDTPVVTRKFKLHHSCSVFQAELLAIQEACRWAINNRYPHILIFTDSLASIKAIQNRSNTHPLVTQIHRLLYDYKDKGILEINWVQSHVGIIGNEAADKEANDASKLCKENDYSLFPISYVKQQVNKENRNIWQERYANAEQGAQTKKHFPHLDDIKQFCTKVKTSFQLTQILTGHGFHKAYLHRFHITPDDKCPCDGTSIQTIDHLLEHCPRFGSLRHSHETLCTNLRVPPYEIKELCKKESTIKSFVSYIESIVNNLKSFNNT
ncbi:RNase H domain-containing protein [Phthorimaea operculella]|nr:RNase H domain-containing protein [Phthorimaea operculella]